MTSKNPPEMPETPRWLAILGIGEDGVEAMSPAARALLTGATLVVGGARHLALARGFIQGEQMVWPSPLRGGIGHILRQRPRPVAVLASGDPFVDGIGSLLADTIPVAEIICLPAASAYSLALARLGWPMRQTATLSLCGRPMALLAPLLQPGRRVLCLSADETTPAALAAYITSRGFGASMLHVMEALGGPRERVRASRAEAFAFTDCQRLNLVALEVIAGPNARVIPLGCGLDDDMFEHDGQITKREVRAVTLSSLAPCAGETLWDIGCGAGSVAIEWLLRHPANRAYGIEPQPERAARAARNAISLGVPGLELVQGRAPEALAGLPVADAVFIGGGAHCPGVIEAAWAGLRPGGRLVANAVVIETEAALFAAKARHGGTLTRLGVARLDEIGALHGFRPNMTVTQWRAQKP